MSTMPLSNMQDTPLAPMECANVDVCVMHHDLLIELGRIEMQLEGLQTEEPCDALHREARRRTLTAQRIRLSDALARLPD